MKNVIKTFLPVFSGFYGTLFQDIIDTEEENILEETDKEWDEIEFKTKEMMLAISKECVGVFEKAINRELDLNLSVSFLNLFSPREYNYSNDEIEVEFTISDEDLETIKDTIRENAEEVQKIITERYSSREGFISMVSTDLNDWIDDLNNEHKFGAILEILCEVLNVISEEEMVDRVRGNVSLDYNIK